MKGKVVEIRDQIGEIVPPPQAKYLHQKMQELTLLLKEVEMSEVVEILSDYLWIAATILPFLYWRARIMLHLT